jgi:hypothetical protein
VSVRLTTRPGHPTFADLPWELPLAQWDSGRIVTPVRGISRHVVRFVAYGDAMYALKELPERLALREYRLLRELAAEEVPVVEAVGVAGGRQDAQGEELDAVLVTRHLDFSLPYLALFSRASMSELWDPLLDALAQLLVQLHLVGFFWGDCSLSNTLFGRDAGALAAALVDAETGERHAQLSDGQRHHDLVIAEENVAGELYDISAEDDTAPTVDPADVADDLTRRYNGLWTELNRTELVSSADRRVVEERVRRLNELGFDVQEVQLETVDGGWRLRLSTAVVEPGHHRRRLVALTGLDVQENQARRLLNDIRGYGAWLESSTGVAPAEPVAALRWLVEIFEPAIAAVPAELRGKLAPAELFHQILEHRWFMAEATGRDVGTVEAVGDYARSVLRQLPDEQRLVVET